LSETPWNRVEELFHQALDLPSEARAAFLQKECGADEPLRREVESLLAHESEAGETFIGQAAPRSFDHYCLEEKLGEGGMGVVYRGIDTKLGRAVAIKFLHEDLVDAAARKRFQREAQLASSLNHPHILTVHDIGEFEGRQYLVTELVDGGTLKDWANQEKRSPLEIVELITGIADAIAAAHDAGLLHRDIKPGNILISKSGYAKLADFGLARWTEAGRARHSEETRTHTGMIMGTPSYMSPEQASGQTLDARSDIFSFGVVLYELVAGRRPFVGNTGLEILHKITTEQAPPLDASIADPLRQVIEKTLEKDRGKRYQSMREVTRDLRKLWRTQDTDTLENPAAGAARKTVSSTKWWPWALTAAVVAGFVVWEQFRPVPLPGNPLANATFSRITDFGGVERSPAISPDGKFIAFVSDHDGSFDVWLSQSANGNPQNLTKGKAGDVQGPLRDIGFSGDGSEVWIAGTQKPQRRMQLIPLIGGTPHNFLGADAAEVAWSQDNKYLVYHSWDGDPLYVADANGSNVRLLLAAGPTDEHRHFPFWSQDGRWIYFVRGHKATGEMDLWRIPSAGGEPERITKLNTDMEFPTQINARTFFYIAPDANGAGPWLWSLDLETKASQRLSVGFEQYAAISATNDGRKLVASVVNSKVNLWSLPISSKTATESEVKAFPLPNGRALAPRFAGGTLFFLSSKNGADGLWRYRDGRSEEIWKGSEGALRSPAAISPDGRTIAIAFTSNGKRQWHLIAADGTQLRSLGVDVDARGTASWSPDGNWIVSGGSDAKGEGLFKIPINGGAPVRLRSGPALDPVWSPKGDLIVYGGANVFTNVPLEAVRPDGSKAQLPPIIVRREGERMRFLPDGSGLVYMQNATTSQDFWLLDFATMKSSPLSHLQDSAIMRTFDVSTDGKQIVFDRAKEDSDIVLIDLAGKGSR
jgi:Tol biopolymer transport system component/predicted Ser/Thr protein kinase